VSIGLEKNAPPQSLDLGCGRIGELVGGVNDVHGCYVGLSTCVFGVLWSSSISFSGDRFLDSRRQCPGQKIGFSGKMSKLRPRGGLAMVITMTGMRCVVFRASRICMSTKQCHRRCWRGLNPSPDRLTFEVKPGRSNALTF
jgi:hypothetical protein